MDRDLSGTPWGELALVERIRKRAEQATQGLSGQVRLGIGDDCAVLRLKKNEEIVVTTDFSLEGRHFRRDWHSPQSIGHRTLARGLSDLAAMGARPVAAFLSLALPLEVARDGSWTDRFLDGLLGLASFVSVPLAGGDTSQAPGAQVLADVTLVGAVPRGHALRRDGARAGDELFVTGTLGGAAAQLETLLREGPGESLSYSKAPNDGSQPHFFPEPRLRTGRHLLKAGLSAAAMDLSDGLSTDLARLCTASGLCAVLDEAALPVHRNLCAEPRAAALHAALHGGEDYELLFTARPGKIHKTRYKGVPVTRIGQMVRCKRGRPQVALADESGAKIPLLPGGWEHLR